MNTIHNQDLSIITWIGEYFLVTGHACIKTNFTGSCAFSTIRGSVANCSVFKQEYCGSLGFVHFLKKGFAKKMNSKKLSGLICSHPRFASLVIWGLVIKKGRTVKSSALYIFNFFNLFFFLICCGFSRAWFIFFSFGFLSPAATACFFSSFFCFCFAFTI